ncbi:hypothetical protein I2I05_20475 [Hymenobacter sp. BT683]|uniref:Lipocalin-like domain-containing protein n=1 Tax=Hymenobacter jeongseonensis TaxID=2791027 RepID=A0ABS0IN49_9BACT|nr:hypothetical protein [Hymenobacter jeongseonensis]MBF9239781.1 hypothetical protein [Hymenobacter jeongseonensis]
MTTPLRLLLLVLLTSSTLVLTDCSKTTDPAGPTRTEREKFLTAPNWFYSSITKIRATPAGVVTTTPNYEAGFDPCSLDDLTRYKTDHTFSVDEGPLNCNIIGRTLTGTWELAANDTQLVLNPDQPNPAPHQIQALTATSLSYTISEYTQSDGTLIRLIAHFTAR